MRLVIDCFKLIKGAGKSIGIYNLARTLVNYLAKENVSRGLPHEIVVMGNEKNRKDFEREGVTFVSFPGNPRNKLRMITWELFEAAWNAKKLGADRVLFPRGYRPLVYGGKDTIIIHDLIPFFYDEHFPGYFGRLENAYIMNRLKASIRGADQVITISEYSKGDILARVPGVGDKISVIYNGLNDVKVPEGGQTLMEGRYIVSVTSSLPHKNASGVLAAYDEYRKTCKDPLPLAVVGIGDTAPFVEKGVISAEAAAFVTCFSYIDNYADLCALIHGAVFFLFLSLIEGFGFPPLEAMQLSCPVISSGSTSLAEVLGDAAVVVDPEKPEETAAAMAALQEDEAKRRLLVEKGLANIRRFTWDRELPLYWERLFS